MKSIHLGFEVGTGVEVRVPLLNLAVTGQTQESGKTTALEALISRADVPAIAFITKRGESAFANGRRLQPYFRDRADWQFVTSIIDATLQEKNKFLRPWIMKICRATKTLADVQREVRKALKDAKGINEGVYTQLDAYLELIVPEIQRADLAESLSLQPGLNVMDVSSYPTPMQMLFIQSAIDWVNHHAGGVVTIIPEAWEMIPEGKSSPVTNSAVTLVRKGSALGNHIWADSQDMAGVAKVILRGCPVWLIGVQREANEIKRNLDNIPAGIRRPSAADIANLDRGQFYACWKDKTVKVYVQPVWMDEKQAREIAMGINSKPIDRPAPIRIQKEMEESVSPQEAARLTQENTRLKGREAELLRQIEELKKRGTEIHRELGSGTAAPFDEEAVFDRFKSRLLSDLEEPKIIRVLLARPELQVKVERKVVEIDGSTIQGGIALLIKEGFFDSIVTGSAVFTELKRRGIPCAKPNAYNYCDKLNSMGFLTKEADGYKSVPGMKINLVQG